MSKGMLLAVVAGAFFAALAVAVVQHMTTGDVSPVIAGGVAGGVSAAIYVAFRRR